MLAAKVAWLDGRQRWRDGRVVWETAHGTLAPTPADIARAQRCLNKIAQYRYAAPAALGDADAWRRERQARLELAKRLCAAPPDPAALLVAEALCLDPLPGPPSRALLGIGASADVSLRDLAEEDRLPETARVLAALTLGVRHRHRDAEGSPVTLSEPGLRRAYAWGREQGLPDEAALAAALLRPREGDALLRRCQAARHAAPQVGLPSLLLRELLADGVEAAAVVALAEAVAALEPLAARLRARRHELPMHPIRLRRAVSERIRANSGQALRRFAALTADYARAAGGDPEVVRRIAALTEVLLALGPMSAGLSETILKVLQQGASLPAPLRDVYLLLVTERGGDIWNRSSLPDAAKSDAASPRFGAWLQERWEKYGTPLAKLLWSTQDAALVREANDLRLLRLLLSHATDWDRDRLRLLVDLVRRFRGAADPHALLYALNDFPSAREARAALRPLLNALTGVPAERAGFLLENLLAGIPQTRRGRRETLPRLAPYLPRLLRLAAESAGTEGELCRQAVAAAVALDRAVPDQGPDWLDGLLNCLPRAEGCLAPTHEQVQAIPLAAALGIALADGNGGHFLTIVRAALSHPPRDDRDRLERGIALLKTYPGLRAPLARLFAAQPRRCGELLARIALTTHPGPEAREPLAECRFDETASRIADTDDPEWQAVLALAPGCAPPAGDYWYARWLLGRDAGVPPGVRNALAQRATRRGELDYLEARCLREPDRADLCVRAANLRDRLEQGDRADLGREVAERLTQAAATAQMEAAEQQVSACYRARLAQVAGPLPPGLVLDADLENAAVLTGAIDKNRRLLARLLRASITGDTGWHARHPANQAFREQLAAAGVDADCWQGAHARRAPCPGGLRLHLETDPLRVLQMGNYFGTCLSADDFNAFATVANACEQNKRVLYATDSKGRVVGRKLIGLTADYHLVGFRTYTSLPGEAGDALRAAIGRYLAAFAARCRVPLADEGSVPILLAEGWYDDGVVAWGDETAACPSRREAEDATS